MNAIRVTVAGNGRLSLPIAVRRRLGIENGGELVLKIADGEVTLTTLAETIKRVQGRMRELARGKNISVDDFLAWKREQIALEQRDLAATANDEAPGTR